MEAMQSGLVKMKPIDGGLHQNTHRATLSFFNIKTAGSWMWRHLFIMPAEAG